MIAVDTNLLVYAHRTGYREHRAAQRAIRKAASHPGGWGIPLACLSEFWSVVTHPSCAGGPSSPRQAMGFLEALRAGGALFWAPGEAFWTRLAQAAADLDVRGARIFDLQIGLTALDNGATQIWTRDRNFTSLPGLRVFDPL